MKKLTDKAKVRQDIKSYERNKKLRRLSGLGIAAGTGAAAIGGYKKNPAVMAAGLGGSFLSGFARAKAKKEERASLGRIKRFYDLREKTAVAGGATEAALTIAQTLSNLPDVMQHGGWGPLGGHFARGVAPLALDLAVLPTIADHITKETRRHSYIAAKDRLGQKLTPDEMKYRAKSQAGVAAQEINKLRSPGVHKGFKNWWNKIRHSYKATGGQLGEYAGSALKEVNKFSPTLANAGLNALKDDKGLRQFEKQLKLRGARYQQAANILDQTIDEIPGLRPILRSTGKSSGNLIAELLENPRTAKIMAEQVRSKVVKGVRGGKAGIAALGLAGIGAMAGQYRRRHPLAKDELPSKITSGFQQKMANMLSAPPMPTKNVAAAQPPMPPPPQMSSVGVASSNI